MQDKLIAGDSLNFPAAVSGYPATDGWTLKYRLTPRGAGAAIVLAATPEGEDYRVQASSATTAAWTAGAYGWASWVEKGSERYTIETGQITVAPDPAVMVAGTDTRTRAEIGLESIQQSILGKATSAMQSYQIAGREMRSYSIAELLTLEQKFKIDVARERKAAGLPGYGGTIRMRFPS